MAVRMCLNRRRFGLVVVRSPCCARRRRRRNEGGVAVVELAPPSSPFCRLGVCGTGTASLEELTDPLLDP